MTSLTIDIFSDIICPWCYIGKKRLEAALKQTPDIKPSIKMACFYVKPDNATQMVWIGKPISNRNLVKVRNAVYDRIAKA